ncbi:MAG: hypothetical protein AAF517_18490, partial [Planctomycetota bacterium]
MSIHRRFLMVAFVLVACGLTFLVDAEDAPTLRKDSIVLKNGTKLSGTLFDRTKTRVVFWTEDGKKVFKKSEVRDIERASIDERAKATAKKHEGKSKTKSEWRKLVKYCWDKELYMEYRRALRRLYKLDRSDVKVRINLGHSKYKDEWLSEAETYAKTKTGKYTVDDRGNLVTQAKTVVEKKKKPKGIKVLKREKLSATAQKRMDKERKRRAEQATSFRKKLEREYRGVDWNDRGKI